MSDVSLRGRVTKKQAKWQQKIKEHERMALWERQAYFSLRAVRDPIRDSADPSIRRS
jgi:hypothetical protein